MKKLLAKNIKYHRPVHMYDRSYIQNFIELFNEDSFTFAYANESTDLHVKYRVHKCNLIS